MGLLAKVFLITILLFSPVYGADFYVSQSGAGAKDGSSAANAWETWSAIDWDTDGAGVDTGVGAGDTLYVIGTLRSTSFIISGYGLADDNRLMIASYPATPGKLWKGFELASGSWVGPDAFGAYSQALAAGDYSARALEWDTTPWTYTALTIMTVVPDETWVGNGLYYLDNAGDVAYYKPATPATPLNVTAMASTTRVFDTAQLDYITISGLTLNGPLRISNAADYWILDGLDVSCITIPTLHGISIGDGSDVAGNYGGIIRNCTIHDCGNGIYFINQDYADSRSNNNWTVEDNTIYNIHGTSDSHGIGVQGNSNSIFQRNTIYNTGTGITLRNHLTQTMQNNIIRYNYIYHVGYYYETDGADGRGIEFSGEANDSELTTGHLVYYNIVRDCYRDADNDPDGVGIRFKTGLVTSGYAIKVMNNIVSDCYYNIYMQAATNESNEIAGYMRNNISHNPKSGGWHVYITALGETFDLSFDYNIYYGAGKFSYEGTTWTTLADWQTNMTPQDANSKSDDPLFVNATAYDFHLQATSPAINTGTSVGLTTDYQGNHVPKGSAPDIGAYEYGTQALVGTGAAFKFEGAGMTVQ